MISRDASLYQEINAPVVSISVFFPGIYPEISGYPGSAERFFRVATRKFWDFSSNLSKNSGKNVEVLHLET